MELSEKEQLFVRYCRTEGKRHVTYILAIATLLIFGAQLIAVVETLGSVQSQGMAPLVEQLKELGFYLVIAGLLYQNHQQNQKAEEM